jgi:hypothetical protein
MSKPSVEIETNIRNEMIRTAPSKLCLLFYHEDGRSAFLWNISKYYHIPWRKFSDGINHPEEFVFWNVVPCNMVRLTQCFGGTCRLHLHGRRLNQARYQKKQAANRTQLKVEASSSSVTSAVCGIMFRKDKTLHCHHSRNLKFRSREGICMLIIWLSHFVLFCEAEGWERVRLVGFLCCLASQLFFSMAAQPSGPWPLSKFLNLYRVGRSPWTGDQPVARPLPAHRTT